MKTKDAYTELAIQIATLDMKLNKILELLNKPEIKIKTFKDILPEDIERARELFKDLESTTDYDLTKPYGFDFEPIQRKINKELQGVYDAYKKVEK